MSPRPVTLWGSTHVYMSRGRLRVQVWVDIEVVHQGVSYLLGAEAQNVEGCDEDRDVDPLAGGHEITLGGVRYSTHEAAPPAVFVLALEACRGLDAWMRWSGWSYDDAVDAALADHRRKQRRSAAKKKDLDQG